MQKLTKKEDLGETTGTWALFHWFDWAPLRVHRVTFCVGDRDMMMFRDPMPEPTMWYQKVKQPPSVGDSLWRQ